jgi:hypothetical protein
MEANTFRCTPEGKAMLAAVQKGKREQVLALVTQAVTNLQLAVKLLEDDPGQNAEAIASWLEPSHHIANELPSIRRLIERG